MDCCKNGSDKNDSMILKAKCENTKHAVGPIMSADDDDHIFCKIQAFLAMLSYAALHLYASLISNQETEF